MFCNFYSNPSAAVLPSSTNYGPPLAINMHEIYVRDIVAGGPELNIIINFTETSKPKKTDVMQTEISDNLTRRKSMLLMYLVISSRISLGKALVVSSNSCTPI